MEKKNKENKPVITRAEKRDNVKNLVREILTKGSVKASDLIDEAAKLYIERFSGEDTENPNDVKGRVGSVLDVMKKESEVQFDGGVYALNASKQEEIKEETGKEKPVKKTRKTAKKTVEEPKEETQKPVKAKRTVSKKKEEKKEEKPEEKIEPLPPAPLQPIAPTAPITPEIAPEPIPEDTVKGEEKPAPKKRGRAKKSEAKEEIKEELKEETKTEKLEKDVTPKGTLMDMSFLFGDIKPTEKKPKPLEAKKEQEKEKEQPAKKEEEIKAETKPQPKKAEEKKPAQKSSSKAVKKPLAPLTADEKLQEAFLNKLRRLGGEYFEYYSVYLLEKYSRKNGRRLESLKITGGDHDGGIDGEIELTDKLGFKETIYIQSKNWDPSKGSEKLWVVGETLLQQFIGACVCRQAKDGKQHCRGIFMTTSRFTPEAKRILEETSDKFVGYDGVDIYETAKECEFGVIKKNGEWVLDSELLSGTKAFFHMN